MSIKLANAVLAAKIEATAGTAETLANADAAFIVRNVVYSSDPTEIARQQVGKFGNLISQHAPGTAAVSFDIELAGKGASGSPDWAEVLMRGCGWSDATTANTFTFESAEESTLTIGWFADGRRWRISGARGSWSIAGGANGQMAVRFSFIGKEENWDAASLLTPTLPTVIGPIFRSGNVSYGAYTPQVQDLTIDSGIGPVLQPNLIARIPNHNARASMTVDSDTIASQDWQSIKRALSTATLTVTVGASANNTITITAAAAQVVDVQPGDQDGFLSEVIGLNLTGEKPVTIAFT